MLTQIDCWESPAPAEVAEARAAVPSLFAWQGYVPGWGAPYDGGWSAAGVRAVLQDLGRYLPLLVPSSGNPASCPRDAAGWDVAVAIAREHVGSGGGLFRSCGIDVEASWAAAYPAGWKAAAFAFALACRRDNIASVVYGPPSFLASLIGPAAPSVIYAGDWPNGANAPTPVPSSPSVIAGIPDSAWDGPGQRIWQYQGGHAVGGLPIDVDSSVTTAEVPYCVPALALPTPPPDPAPTPSPATPAVLAPGEYTDGARSFTLTIP